MAGLLSIGARAMLANTAALHTISQNIANANTPGYSRQSAVLTTSPGQYTGAGFFGRGVDISTVVRSHNDFLTTEASNTAAIASQDMVRMEQLQRLEKVFRPGTDGIGYSASQFLNAMVDVTSRPNDPSARQVALGRAAELSARFTSAGAQLDQMQAGVVGDLKARVVVINQLAAQIAHINELIAKTRGTGHEPNDLLDQRERLISDLSTHVAVTTLPADDGTVGVFIGGGQRLVLGNAAQQLEVGPDAYDPTKATLNLREGSKLRNLDPSVLTGGAVTALLSFQNEDLTDARNMLGQLAAAFGTRINTQNGLGLDLSNPPGKGAPIFNVASPRVMPADTNQRNPDSSFVSGISASIDDASLLQASSYKFTTDASGTYTLTRLSDGYARTVADGDSVDGFTLSFSPAAPAPGESFVIEPVGAAASNFRRVLDLPSGLAAASPLTGSASVNNTGTLSVDSLYAVNDKLNLTQAPIQLDFGDPDPTDATKLQYTLTLADGTVLNGTWAAGQPIGNEPALGIDLGFELRTNGVPRKNDRITLETTIYTGTNNGNAKAFLNVQAETFIGRRVKPDGSIAVGSTITDAYASSMSEIGARVQGATYLSSVSTTTATDARTAAEALSGVNLDEEAARLLQYQQAYQAAAKVMQTAQTIFDELMRVAAR